MQYSQRYGSRITIGTEPDGSVPTVIVTEVKGFDLRILVVLPCTPYLQGCLTYVDIARTLLAIDGTMDALAADTFISTRHDCIHGRHVLMKYPSLDHVASLAVGCLESGDEHDRGTVNE